VLFSGVKYIGIRLFLILLFKFGDWGLGIGDWGLGIGPIPNPKSPIPKPHKLNKN